MQTYFKLIFTNFNFKSIDINIYTLNFAANYISFIKYYFRLSDYFDMIFVEFVSISQIYLT